MPEIQMHERTPLVDQLVEIINQQKQQLEVLGEEVKRLKKLIALLLSFKSQCNLKSSFIFLILNLFLIHLTSICWT